MRQSHKLPIGIQSFAKIRQEGYYYVDKTPFVARLAEEGSSHEVRTAFNEALLTTWLPEPTRVREAQQKNYAAKYMAPGVAVLQVGIEFSKTTRQIVGWEVA